MFIKHRALKGYDIITCPTKKATFNFANLILNHNASKRTDKLLQVKENVKGVVTTEIVFLKGLLLTLFFHPRVSIAFLPVCTQHYFRNQETLNVLTIF